MQFLGRDQTLEVSPQFCRAYLAECKPEYQAKRSAAREMSTGVAAWRRRFAEGLFSPTVARNATARILTPIQDVVKAQSLT